MDFLKYITEQALILVPALYVIGLILKNSAVKDKYIPIVLLVIGIAASVGIIGFTIPAVIQGVLVTGATVFGNQLVKQASKEE